MAAMRRVTVGPATYWVKSRTLSPARMGGGVGVGVEGREGVDIAGSVGPSPEAGSADGRVSRAGRRRRMIVDAGGRPVGGPLERPAARPLEGPVASPLAGPMANSARRPID